MKLQKKYVKDCKGKQITFKELKERQTEAKTATAQIKVPATVDSDSEGEAFYETHAAGVKADKAAAN